MATPHVSGIAVLLLDSLNQNHPDWNRKKKADTVKKIPDALKGNE